MSSGTEAIGRKQRIRDRYRGVDTSELEVIPAKIVEGLGESTSIRRVAAYVRVSTGEHRMESGHDCRHHCKRTPLWGCVGEKDLHTKLSYAQGKEEQQ